MTVKFIPSGRGRAQCPPDPRFPEGIEIDLREKPEMPYCRFDLPYPAPECGMFKVQCDNCGLTLMVTAAGRVDDPTAVIVPCGTGTQVH